MALNLNPHQYAVDPNTNAPILTRVQPYVRLRDGTDPPMFLQAGNVYSEGGDLVDPDRWPSWLHEAILDMGMVGLEESGFTSYVQKVNTPAAQKPTVAKKP